MRTVEELTEFARDFLRNEYGQELQVPIIINGRLSRSMGRYDYVELQRGQEIVPRRIHVSRELVTYGTESVIKSVLIHELIHMALSIQGLPFDDGDYEFESELRRHNSIPTGSTIVGKYINYRCGKCGEDCGKFNVKRNLSRYISVCCSAKLVADGGIIYNGERSEVCTV